MTRPVAALILAALIIAASAPSSAPDLLPVPASGTLIGAPQRLPGTSVALGLEITPLTGSESGGAPFPPDPSPLGGVVGLLPAAQPTEPIPTPAPTSAISWIVDGIASTYGPGWDGRLALPAGRGIRFRVCGPAACAVRVSNDAGPDLAMQRKGRVVDLDVPTFELVCGCKWTRGLVRVTVEGL